MSLALSELRMPQIHDEHDARLVVWVVMPHLVVKRVVKDKDGALLPRQVRLVGHSQLGAAARGHLETQVGPQAAVGGSRVGVNVSAGLHHAEFNLAPFVG